MTERQMKVIARALKQNYEHADTSEARDALATVMIDIANEVDTFSTTFNRSKFLELCGHPQYQKRK